MSSRSTDAQLDIRPPRDTKVLFGHGSAEATLLNAYSSGRIPHAWLIGGQSGIGKATLAYRMARFVLAHPDPAASDVQSAQSLDVDLDETSSRHISAGTHGSLLVLERTLNEKGVLRTAISVDEARETVSFFGSTAGHGGWRICIVDTVDELNPNSANALLKIIEEPPANALFLLVSNAPARVMPTIQSRCRKLKLRPLDTADVVKAVAHATSQPVDDPSLEIAAAASGGSVAQALTLLGGKALALQQRTKALLDTLPHVDPLALHALGDAMSGNDRAVLATFVDSIDLWLTAHLRADDANANLARLARLSEVWEKVNRVARDTEIYNLDRKPLVFSVFGLLAEVA